MADATSQAITIRLTPDEAAMVAAHVDRLTKKSGGARVSSSHAIRSLLRIGATEVARTR